MTKFLLLVLLIVAVLWGPLSRLRAPERRPRTATSPPKPSPSGQAAPQDMVPCAHCGLHLPRADAMLGPEHGRGLMFCSAEHRRLGPHPDAG